jgi:hypothetical protein
MASTVLVLAELSDNLSRKCVKKFTLERYWKENKKKRRMRLKIKPERKPF